MWENCSFRYLPILADFSIYKRFQMYTNNLNVKLLGVNLFLNTTDD